MKFTICLILVLFAITFAKSQNERWDDQFISSNAPNGNVYAIDKINTDLYVAGDFSMAGSITVNNIAKWDGSSWSALGTGTNGPIYALCHWNNKLYIGGSFSIVDGVPANNIAFWDGTSWNALGTGTNDTVFSLVTKGDYEVYAGGSFDLAGGVTVNNIAKWDGSAWTSLGSGINGNVYSLAVWDTIIIAGGKFSNAGGTSVNNLTSWFSNTWHDIAGGTNDTVFSIYSFVDSIIIGGSFSSVGTSITATKLASYNGTTWNSCGNISGQSIYDITYSDSKLYITGYFNAVESLTANNAAYMDSTGWHIMGDGLNSTGNTLTELNKHIYFGGNFTNAGNKPSYYFAKWISLPKILQQPTDISVCQNDTAFFTIDIANHSIPVSYQWKFNGSDIVGATDDTLFITNVSLTDEGYYSCLISSTYYDILSDSAYLDVIENVSFIANPQDTAFCENENVTLTSNVTGEYYTLQWYHNGLAITGTNNESFVILNASQSDSGEYFCIATNLCSIDSSDIANISVYPLPSVSYTGLENYYCNSDAPDTLHATPTGGVFSGNGMTDSIFNPHSVSGTIVVQYQYINSYGCSATYYDTTNIYIPPTIYISGLESNYCYNDNADTLHPNLSGGYFSGQGISDSIFDPSTAGYGNIILTYTYTDTNNCTYNKPLYTNVFQPANAIFTGIDSSYCGSNPPVAFQVYPAGGTLSGVTSDTIFYPDSAGIGTHEIYYTFTDTNSCVSVDTFTIEIFSNLSIDLGNDTSICRGETIEGLPGYVSYLWSTGDTTMNINVEQTDNYYLTVTDNNGCMGSDNIMVTVLSTPDINLGDDFSITTDQTTILGAGGNYSSYLWNTGSSSSFIVIDGDALGVGTYTYWVNVTANSGCTDSDTIVVTVTYGLWNEQTNEYALRVYPNPVNDYLNVECESSDNYQIIIEDINGHSIYKERINNSRAVIPFSGLSDGIYILKVITDNKVYYNKLLKSN
ncbi:MAG: hypothetical protein Kow0068_05690 [Marinilabiliales bacterium]